MHNTSTPPVPKRLRFGLFELDPAAEELRKGGIKLRIQGQPFRILLHLVQRSGEIVSREELHRTFWKRDTTVDLDRSLAAAIHKIRECLDDSVTSPRFVETVSRTGYRFIAPVAEIQSGQPVPEASPVLLPENPVSPSEAAAPPNSPPVPSQPKAPLPKPIPLLFLLAAAVIIFIFLIFSLGPARIGAPVIHAITHNALVSPPDSMSQGFPGAATDNARIYFARTANGRGELAVVMLNGGDTITIALPEELGSPVVDDVSTDGLRLLLRDRLSTAAEQPLWVASPAGQTARQIPGVLAHDSAWMGDGTTILYANGDALYTVRDNGFANTRFATLPGRPFRMRWSPDGKLLRLTLRDDHTLTTSLWELRANGSGAHQILSGWHHGASVCCGTFLHSGDLYVFQAGGSRNGSLWAVPIKSGWLGRQSEPIRVAEGPLSYVSPVAKRDGNGIVFTGMVPSFRLMRWSTSDNRLLPAPDFLADAERVEISADGRSVAWVRRDDGSLWRSHINGDDRVRVLGMPYEVFNVAWSPDATRLAIMARRPGAPWRILIADVNSGHTEDLLDDDPHNQADPQWTADGSAILFGRLPQRLAEPGLTPKIFRVELSSHKASELPGSTGLFSPRISPDGRTLIALNTSQTILRQLDLAAGSWTTAGTGHFDDPQFLAGGRSVVFRDFSAPGLTLLQLDLTSHRILPFAYGLNTETGLIQPRFAGLLAGNSPAISVARMGPDLYELEVPE